MKRIFILLTISTLTAFIYAQRLPGYSRALRSTNSSEFRVQVDIGLELFSSYYTDSDNIDEYYGTNDGFPWGLGIEGLYRLDDWLIGAGIRYKPWVHVLWTDKEWKDLETTDFNKGDSLWWSYQNYNVVPIYLIGRYCYNFNQSIAIEGIANFGLEIVSFSELWGDVPSHFTNTFGEFSDTGLYIGVGAGLIFLDKITAQVMYQNSSCTVSFDHMNLYTISNSRLDIMVGYRF